MGIRKNKWTYLSIQKANSVGYLDDLFKIYSFDVLPTPRILSDEVWNQIRDSYMKKDNVSLIKQLLKLERFPINNPYIGFLRKNKKAIKNNATIITKIGSLIQNLGIENLKERCEESKASSRQMGPKFRKWLETENLGVKVVKINSNEFDIDSNFIHSNEDIILTAGDKKLKSIASDFLGYTGKKGIDFLAKINGSFIIGEAKFITNFGGSQNEQFNDATSLLEMNFSGKEADMKIHKIAILDGVLYLKNAKYNEYFKSHNKYNIMSCLVLKDYIKSLRKIES